MTKTEIENKIHDLKRNIESCKNIIESCENIIKTNENKIKKLEAEKEEPAFERVEEGKKYYAVAFESYEGFFIKEYIEENMRFDKTMFKNNNYFLARERAEEVADKINFLLKLERLHDIYCPDYKPDWNDDATTKWYVVFNSDQKVYTSYWTNFIDDKRSHFDSEETAEKVCEILNKELGNA